MPYRVVLKPSAAGELHRLPVRDRLRIVEAFSRLAVQPMRWESNLDTKPVRGHPGLWRLSVGVWRAFYRVDGNIVRVGAVRPRAGNPYRELKGI